jgi:hypothetical protein
VIVSAGAELAHVSDQADFLVRVDEAEVSLAERGLELLAVVADKGHHCGENLAGLEERGLCGLVAAQRRATGAPGFARHDFVYDPASDTFRCPAGNVLTRLARDERGAPRYKAQGRDCRACPHFGVGTKSQSGRRLKVPVHEAAIVANRERVHTADYRPLLQIRRQRGEAPFAYFKSYGGLRRLAGRGLAYAQKKTVIAAAGWNLLRLLAALFAVWLRRATAVVRIHRPHQRERRWVTIASSSLMLRQYRLPGEWPNCPLSGAC